MRINTITHVAVIALLLLLGLPVVFAGQADVKKPEEKPAGEAPPLEIPLKVQIVLSEFDGNQKISSLPYTLNMLATGPHDRQIAYIRVGVKVPVSTSQSTFTYDDVGTNLDGRATVREDGSYRLDLTIDRSTVTMPNSGTDWKPGQSYTNTEPLIRSFRDEFTLIMRDGQTVQGTSAVDPVTGHVLKVDVTLTVLK